MAMQKSNSIEAYIASFPKSIQEIVIQIRTTIKNAAPQAEEKISYGMPAFFLKGQLVYYAAFKNHIGFYALPSGNKAFQKELVHYKVGKGSIQFPITEKIPYALITKMVKFRIKENLEKEKLKLKKSR
jgi:uncharacterized protein YdhG (YjbR/CyaY superfamily)